jgi:hypothetical protein
MSVSVGVTCWSGYVTAGASGALGGPVVALAAASIGAYSESPVGAMDVLGNQE